MRSLCSKENLLQESLRNSRREMLRMSLKNGNGRKIKKWLVDAVVIHSNYWTFVMQNALILTRGNSITPLCLSFCHSILIVVSGHLYIMFQDKFHFFNDVFSCHSVRIFFLKCTHSNFHILELSHILNLYNHWLGHLVLVCEKNSV